MPYRFAKSSPTRPGWLAYSFLLVHSYAFVRAIDSCNAPFFHCQISSPKTYRVEMRCRSLCVVALLLYTIVPSAKSMVSLFALSFGERMSRTAGTTLKMGRR